MLNRADGLHTLFGGYVTPLKQPESQALTGSLWLKIV